MNDSIFPSIHPINPPSHPGVYADLAELVRLKFRTRGFSFLPRQPVHSILAGRHASQLRGRGLNFEQIRRYLPGDDIRHMDWRVTARTRTPHVRVYSEERDRPVLLVIDPRQNMFFGRRAMKSVVAAEVSALADWRVLQAGDRVGALVFEDAEVVEIPPQRSEQQVLRILGTVVRKNHALRVDPNRRANPAMLNRVLERVARLALHDYLVCAIGDAFGADPESVRYMTVISAHNDVLFALIYDPLEETLPNAGRLIMAEGKLQLEVNTANPGLRQHYHTEFEQRLARIHELSRQREIPVLPLSTAEPVPEQVRRLLGDRPEAWRRR
jgi:uncharacterized protein (DUF58 family)